MKYGAGIRLFHGQEAPLVFCFVYECMHVCVFVCVYKTSYRHTGTKNTFISRFRLMFEKKKYLLD